MDLVTGDEAKVRAYELPPAANIAQTARVSIDDISEGAKSASAEQLVAFGVMRTPFNSGVPPAGSTILVTDPSGISARRAYETISGELYDYYLGPYDNPPLTGRAGEPLVPGHSYFNTTDNNSYVYSIYGEWQLFAEPVPSSVRVYKYTIVTETTLLPVLDDFGNALEFDVVRGDAVSLYLNGSRQVGGVDFLLNIDATITLLVPMPAGNIVEVQVLGRPSTRFSRQAILIDTSLWVLNGITKTFDLQQSAGIFVSPANAAACMVCLGASGVQPVPQRPGVQFTIAGSKITFALAPSPGTTVWMVVAVVQPNTRVSVSRTAAFTMDETYDGLTVSMRTGGVIIDVVSPTQLGVGFACKVIAPSTGTAITLRGPALGTVTLAISTSVIVAVRTTSAGGLAITVETLPYVALV